uniref:G-protein coupled receptors family 1 profile domain-containing protein n=1 Tax=Amphimedon queenslandica TaxID=400682 RepID=A0A1X7V7H9_AMPQE
MSNNSTDYSYPCGLPPDFPPSFGIPPAINYIQAGIALVTGIIGLLLNIFILFIIIKYRSLHQRLMFIAIQITIVEIAYSLLVPPAIVVSGIARDWLLGEAMCNILGIVNDGFAYFRFMMTFILTLDRFVSVFLPFFYEKHSKRIIYSLLSLVYFTTFFRVLLPVKGIMGCYIYAYRLRRATRRIVPENLSAESQRGNETKILKESFQFFTNITHGAFFAVVMLVGRTSFNSIPVVDAIAIMKDKEFREAAKKLILSIRERLDEFHSLSVEEWKPKH